MRKRANGEHSGEPCERGPSQTLSQQIRELRAEVAELNEAGAGSLTDTLAHWLAAHYVAAAKAAAKSAGAAGIELKTLRGLSADVVALRKGDHSAARLLIEREWLEIERGKSDERMRKKFEEWLKEPGTKERIHGKELSLAERQQRIRQIFGLSEGERPGLSKETLTEIERAAKLL